MPKYRVLIGLNYPPGDKRAEPGAVVDDIPPGSVAWLIRDKIIEPVDDKTKKRPNGDAKEDG